MIDSISDSILSHICRIVTAANIGIRSQVFIDMGGVISVVIADDSTIALGPGTDDHGDFILIRQMFIVGDCLEELEV